MLRQRQLIDPLPDFAHDALTRLLNEPSPKSTAALAAALAAAPEPASTFEPAALVGPAPHQQADDQSDVTVPLAQTNTRAPVDNHFEDHEAPSAPGGPASATWRLPTKSRAVGLGVALVVIVIGWICVRPATTRHSAQPGVGADAGADAGSDKLTAAPPVAATAPGTIIQDCPTCPRMTVLPAGRFKLGSAYDEHDALPSEKPQHIVLIRRPPAMATTELTVDDFRAFVADTNRDLQGCEIYDHEWHHAIKANWQDPGFAQGADHPATCVSWNDATAYAEWLSAKTGHHYRLPSAAEWEYAARAGSDARLPWGPGPQAACENANVADRSAARRYPKWHVFACQDGYVNTSPVGSFKANAFGINDMLGNVFEWTQDCWHDDYSKAPIDGSARMDGDCGEHELRGGSWFSSPAFVRPAYRNHGLAGYRNSSIGVRLVRELTP